MGRKILHKISLSRNFQGGDLGMNLSNEAGLWLGWIGIILAIIGFF